MGRIEVHRAPVELAALGLGSCVAVLLDDRPSRIGGLAHVLLPAGSPNSSRPDPARYAQTAVPALVQQMAAEGAERRRLTARLIGGATMFANLVAPGLISIGERNTLAARKALDALGIRLVGEAVGADFGRSVFFDVGTGRVEVRSVLHGVVEL